MRPSTHRALARMLDRAAEQFEGFHWGNEPRRVAVVDAPEPSGVLVEIGELVSLTYRTAKGGRRRDDWIHFLETPLPRLAFDSRTGELVIVGGGYSITAAGIEG